MLQQKVAFSTSVAAPFWPTRDSALTALDGFAARSHMDCREFVNKRDRVMRALRPRCGEGRLKAARMTDQQRRVLWDRRGISSCLPRF